MHELYANHVVTFRQYGYRSRDILIDKECLIDNLIDFKSQAIFKGNRFILVKNLKMEGRN